MSFSHLITRTVSPSTGNSVGGQFTLSSGGEVNVDEPIPAATTNLPLAFAVAVAKAKSIVLLSDVDLIVKTNSSGDPDNTFDLQAGVPLIWTAADGSGWVDTDGTDVTDITSLFVTNADAENAARFQILALVDPT